MCATREVSRTTECEQDNWMTQQEQQEICRLMTKWEDERIEREIKKKEQLEREQEKEKKIIEKEQLKLKQEQLEQKKKRQEMELELEQEKLKREQLDKEKQEIEKAQSQKAQRGLKTQEESEFESKKGKKKTQKFLEVDSATEKQVKVDEEAKLENRPYTEKAEEILAEVKNIIQGDVKEGEKIETTQGKNEQDQTESSSERVDSLLIDAQNLLLGLNLKKSKTREAETKIETEAEAESTGIFFDAVYFFQPPTVPFGQWEAENELETSTAQAEIFRVSSPSSEIPKGEEQNLLKTNAIQSPKKTQRKKTMPAASKISNPELKSPIEKMENMSKSKKKEPVQIVELKKHEFPSEKKIGSSLIANWSKPKGENVHFGSESDSASEFQTELESASKLDSGECCPFLSFVLPCIFARLK